ncbi:BTB/POZ domain-containing protein At3g49900 [Prosopis cineraria]|uniref:BTB/POZ domain-containing protein At3g49900 n=1 Tax=Prosopis cineraria TaxID=364024 RepID=UPI0024103F0C|nr:BTB/POZ domain-containing protein At3g49900 [Prosopis cineraria]
MQTRNWGSLGVVETIYEEECEFSSSSSPSVSPSLLSPHTPLHSRVEAWSLATGRETDILIRVQGTCFRLHKERLTSRSSYLKRHLTEVVSDFTLSPPFSITAETFTSIADFCYGSEVQITPSNVAALRTATELLGMTEARGIDDEENLGQVTEAYFRGVIAINQEYASMVLRSCLPLLPEAETSAFLVSRCVEALILAEGGHIEDITCLDDVVAMHPQDFLVVAESMCRRFRNQDILYRLVDLYLKENNFGKLAEEQKAEICNCIDCTRLSPKTLVDCVQNPRMPLRFIIRAMLVEQLNTRNSIVSAAAVFDHHSDAAAATTYRHHRSELDRNSTTLGEHLHHEAVIHHSAHLRAAMESTSSRIQSLEKELRGMKKLLLESSQAEQGRRSKLLDSERPKSFHYVPSDNGNKVERGQRGSISSSSFRFDSRTENPEEFNGAPKVAKTFRQKLINGLKNAFRVSTSASN